MLTALLAIALVLGALATQAQIVVNSTGDKPNAYRLSSGVCSTDLFDRSECTLRAAIQLANYDPNVTTITFNIPTSDPGYDGKKFTIEIGRDSNSPLPDLSTDINISGPGAAKLTVWANEYRSAISRIFTVTTAGTVSFSGLTIGMVSDFGERSPGGVQNLNTGTVNVTNCVITGNVVKSSNTNSKGGGIYNISGTVNVNNSTISANSVSDELFSFTFGGGIFNDSGTVSLTNSRVINNSTQGSGSGGGIFNNTSGTVNVTRCELSGNFGCAIENIGMLNLINSTLCNNGVFFSNGYAGGGALLNGGTSNISNCTLAGNAAYDSTGRGGGIFSYGVVNVKSSIIAANVTSGLGPDVFGSFTSKGFNLIGKKDGSTGFTAATDKKGTIKAPLDPKLDPLGLRSNGGPTQTVALLSGSPAIDKGTSVTIAGTTLTTDQRGSGFPRTHDNGSVANAAGGNGTDIGAFELQTP